MKVYITKYALTRGILKLAGQPTFNQDEDRCEVIFPNGRRLCVYGEDWHETWESAVRTAEATRDYKISCLEQHLAKLRAMKFTDEGNP